MCMQIFTIGINQGRHFLTLYKTVHININIRVKVFIVCTFCKYKKTVVQLLIIVNNCLPKLWKSL